VTWFLVMALAISVAMAVGFALGRIWQIRCDLEQERAGDFTPTKQASNNLDGLGRREVVRTIQSSSGVDFAMLTHRPQSSSASRFTKRLTTAAGNG
jgi:hypothetical protein